jgi:hypothetical protein
MIGTAVVLSSFATILSACVNRQYRYLMTVMTLILTEVSKAGIAMVSDTMIRMVSPNDGQIITGRPPTYHKKLFIIKPLGPLKLSGAVSYWGTIGQIIPDPNEFEDWIGSLAHNTTATSLIGFADELAQAVNARCNNKILSQPVGFHVAGYDAWSDFCPRPTFLHVHNGHLNMGLNLNDGECYASVPTGSANKEQPITFEEKQFIGLASHYINGAKVHYDPKICSRSLFRTNNDFPDTKQNLETNLKPLDQGYRTLNGDYPPIALIQARESLEEKRKAKEEKRKANYKVIPHQTRPSNADYLAKRIEWMINTMNKVKDDKLSYKLRYEPNDDNETFGGPYQKLAFDNEKFYIRENVGNC